jgi:hypothetical protein
MANDYPISEQSGLSDEQLSKMKSSPDQEFTLLTSGTISLYEGVIAQKEKLLNNLRKNIVDYEKARMNADYSDTYATDTCIKNFATNLLDTLLQIVQAQSISVTTEVTVDVTTTDEGELQEDGKLVRGKGTGNGSGSGTSKSVTIV